MVTIKTIASLKDITADADNVQTTMVTRNISPTVAHVYIVYVEVTTDDLVYVKSIDGGATFAAAVIIESTQTWKSVVVWWDSWTPSDSGTLLHILAADLTASPASDLVYFSLDLATDTAGTNNNVLIHTFTDALNVVATSLTITKATNGHLMAAGAGTSGPAGINVEESEDSGATWIDRTGGLPAGTFNAFDDTFHLMPLITNNDLLLIGIDQSATNIVSIEYFNATNTWAGSTTTIDTGAEITNGLSDCFAVTQDRVSGDLFLIYMNGSPTQGPGAQPADLLFKRFDESARTWDTFSQKVVPIYNQPTALSNVSEKVGFSLCYDDTDDLMMLSLCVGNLGSGGNNESYISFFVSSDKGLTWSDGFIVPTVNLNDYRKTSLPMHMQAQTDGFYFVWYEENLNRLDGLNVPIAVTTRSGINYDSDAVTPQAGDPITLEGTVDRWVGLPAGAKKPVHGSVDSAATTGAFKFLIAPDFADETTTASKYKALAFNNVGTAVMDSSREVDADP
jgi:hypothetical protein